MEEELEYISVVEAARRYKVNEKTIRRALHAGAFPARVTKNHKYEIAVTDLEAWRNPPPEGTEQRMATMEQRIQELEQLVDTLLKTVQELQSPGKKPRLPKVRTTGSLPSRLVSLTDFADL